MRRAKPRAVPISPEKLARRQLIARSLISKIEPLSRSLHEMSDAERRAVFYKLEHETPADLGGTGLKPVAQPSERFTLAVPRKGNTDLGKLMAKIEEFGTAPLTTDKGNRSHAPHEHLAAPLVTIEPGVPKDRLSQALYESYDQLVRRDWVTCEIEMVSLFPVPGTRKSRDELAWIRAAVDTLFANKTRGNFFEYEEGDGICRAVIRCTGEAFQQLVEGSEWQTTIWWFEERPSFETFKERLGNFAIEQLGAFEAPDRRAPTVCVIDTGITLKNPFLSPVTRPELLRSFLKRAPDNPYDEYGHGSGVASLAAYYALNIGRGAVNAGTVWLAGARVLNALNELEEEQLFSKLLVRAVEYFKPFGVRVFNLSVNIRDRNWSAETKRTVGRTSWVARTIDRLSQEHDIVFVVSTGNLHPSQIRDHLRDGRPYPDYLSDGEASLLDPGHAALALTVGSLAPDTVVVSPLGTTTAIAGPYQPSPFTRRGPGIGEAIKPELMEFGGNLVLEPGTQSVRSNPGTSMIVANNQLTPATKNDWGTSFAAPRVAHHLARVLADLESMDIGHISAPLMKAFLVNSATWNRRGIEEIRQAASVDGVHWSHLVGYGIPDHHNATACDDYSVVMFHQGTLPPDHVAFFDVPVPKSLASTGDTAKRLTVTVVHAPEVQRWGIERYLGTNLTWRLFRGDISRGAIVDAISKEEAEHDDTTEPAPKPNELAGELGFMRRSRGCVQHDIVVWQRHLPIHSSGPFTLAVATHKRWARKVQPVPFAVVLRLEDTGRTTPIYTEVKEILARIATEVRV